MAEFTVLSNVQNALKWLKPSKTGSKSPKLGQVLPERDFSYHVFDYFTLSFGKTEVKLSQKHPFLPCEGSVEVPNN
jgi:hypothetical protein